ncbi:MAG: flavodoxin [Oscillospiraceae bacterium]|nr:flavodoxin [Oscillospiraceae bacterium]
MNVAVRYYSRGGNTKKLAQAIAQAAGVSAETCAVPLAPPVDLLFLGASVYGGKLDEQMQACIAQLTAEQVKAVALFGTSAFVKSGNSEMEKRLTANGIHVLQPDFYCHGSFLVLYPGHPNENDLAQAAQFARKACSMVSV